MEKVVHLKLTQAQASKVMKGKVVQLKPDQLHGSHAVVLDKDNLKRYKRALKNGTGFRIKLNQNEIMETMNGEGIRDVFKNVGKTIKRVGKKVYKDSIKSTIGELKSSAKSSGKKFAMDALASDNIKGYVKDNSKARALEWAQDEGLNITRKGVHNSILLGEKELEDALIENYGFDEDLARQVVSSGSHRLSKKAYEELMNVDEELTNERNKSPSHPDNVRIRLNQSRIKPNFQRMPNNNYNSNVDDSSSYNNFEASRIDNNPISVDEAINGGLLHIARHAGLKRGRDYTITKGGKLSFKKFIRGLRRVGKKILQVGKPILKPVLNLGAQSLGTIVGGPTGAKIAGVADNGYDMLEKGLGLMPMGGALYPMSYPSYTRGGKLKLYDNPKAGKYIV